MGKVGPFNESMFSCFFYASAQARDGSVLFKNCTGKRQEHTLLLLLSFSDLFLPFLFVHSLFGVSTASKYVEII